MLRPNLDRLWETFVRIGPCRRSTFDAGVHIHVLRRHVIPALGPMRSGGVVGWVHLMIHDDRTFRLQAPPQGDALWHVRLSLLPSADSRDLVTHLPTVFESTRPIPRNAALTIGGLNQNLLASCDVADYWQMLGEQTDWLLRAISLYRDDADPGAIARDLRQYEHLFGNPVYPQFETERR